MVPIFLGSYASRHHLHTRSTSDVSIVDCIDYCLLECDAMCCRFGYLYSEYRGGTFPRNLSTYL